MPPAVLFAHVQCFKARHLAQVLRQTPAPRPVDVGHVNKGALGDESPSDRLANPTRRPGYDRDLAVQSIQGAPLYKS